MLIFTSKYQKLILRFEAVYHKTALKRKVLLRINFLDRDTPYLIIKAN
jgi:hypothetical protein